MKNHAPNSAAENAPSQTRRWPQERDPVASPRLRPGHSSQVARHFPLQKNSEGNFDDSSQVLNGKMKPAALQPRVSNWSRIIPAMPDSIKPVVIRPSEDALELELLPEDFYYEGPYLVFTAAYHLKRGYCCNSDCRHGPYK